VPIEAFAFAVTVGRLASVDGLRIYWVAFAFTGVAATAALRVAAAVGTCS
jgi:hypothetical protein